MIWDKPHWGHGKWEQCGLSKEKNPLRAHRSSRSGKWSQQRTHHVGRFYNALKLENACWPLGIYLIKSTLYALCLFAYRTVCISLLVHHMMLSPLKATSCDCLLPCLVLYQIYRSTSVMSHISPDQFIWLQHHSLPGTCLTCFCRLDEEVGWNWGIIFWRMFSFSEMGGNSVTTKPFVEK